MLEIIRRRLAIRSYRKRLRPFLEQHFGWRVNYTPKEVRSGATTLGLSTVSLCYAYAMFCTPGAFAAYHAATGEHCDYSTMLAETMTFGTAYYSDISTSLDSGGAWVGTDSHDDGHDGHDLGHHDSGGDHDGSGGDGGSAD